MNAAKPGNAHNVNNHKSVLSSYVYCYLTVKGYWLTVQNKKNYFLYCLLTEKLMLQFWFMYIHKFWNNWRTFFSQCKVSWICVFKDNDIRTHTWSGR